MSFYMLAGTLLTDDKLQQLKTRLEQAGLTVELDEDELQIESDAELAIRIGFDHEYILVGDSSEESVIRATSKQLSQALQSLQLPHGYEIYDMQNQMIDEFEYQP